MHTQVPLHTCEKFWTKVDFFKLRLHFHVFVNKIKLFLLKKNKLALLQVVLYIFISFVLKLKVCNTGHKNTCNCEIFAYDMKRISEY